jgi:hypothetical protein
VRRQKVGTDGKQPMQDHTRAGRMRPARFVVASRSRGADICRQKNERGRKIEEGMDVAAVGKCYNGVTQELAPPGGARAGRFDV